ncbi:MAG TPA: toprim domain-containing protein, partial [bacterium]|nr:toprim domain-containing protein [bacterium]
MISEARLPRPVAQAIDELSKLPSIGPKTASRLVFYLLKQPPAQAEALSAALVSLHARLDYCAVCHTITESNPCAICADEQRDHQQICVVSEPLDCYALEKTGQFRGVYHVLQGEISPVDGIGPENLKIKE